MAMSICPKCRKEISDAAKICPHCNTDIDEFRRKRKEELDRLEKEAAEKRRKEAEEKARIEKEKERQTCPECGQKVTLEDKTCPKCGFPLDDELLFSRAQEYHKRLNALKPTFKNTYLGPIICFTILLLSAALTGKCIDGVYNDFILMPEGDILIITAPIMILCVIVLLAMIAYSIKRNEYYENIQYNYEKYLIESEAVDKKSFISRVENGYAFCPYCKAHLTEKSIYRDQKYTSIKHLRCESCGKAISFPEEERHTAEVQRILMQTAKKNRKRNSRFWQW